MRDALMHLIDIKGYGRREVLAEATGLDSAALDTALAELLEDELVEETRLGLRLAAAGKDAAIKLLRTQREQGDASTMHGLYERFEAWNHSFKAGMARWQMRDTQDGPKPNDHSDADYDDAVLAAMLAPHTELLSALGDAATQWPTLALYAERLGRARSRIEAGEQRYISAPLIESYHTVWFELHEALIRFSGRSRAEEAAAGRAV